MPDDHHSWMVEYITDDNHEFAQVTDISDINYGRDFDEDIKTVLGHDNYIS